MRSLEDLTRDRGPVPPTTPKASKPSSRKAPKEREPELPVTTAPAAKLLRKITEPGIYEMTDEEYHADPCPEPSLSASIAKKLIAQSPAHARHAHPRLNPGFAREEKEIFDRGTVAHALLLKGEEVAAVLPYDDWKTQAARAERDALRAEGRVVILQKHWDTVRRMIDRCREQLSAHKEASDAFTNGKPEQVIIWREDSGVWCRAKLDYLHDTRQKIDDYKSTGREVDNESISRHCLDDWEIQDAFYRRGVMKIFREEAQFRFIAQENAEPYAVNVVELGPDFRWLGDEKVQYAIRIFGNCLKTGRWPGYSDRIHCVQKIPKWAEDAWLEKAHGV